MNTPFMLCLRIGNHGIVSTKHHFPTKDAADNARNAILQSSIYRAEAVPRNLGVLVMHWQTFRRLCNEGKAVTKQRLEDNYRLYGAEFSNKSPLYSATKNLYSLFTMEKLK